MGPPVPASTTEARAPGAPGAGTRDAGTADPRARRRLLERQGAATGRAGGAAPTAELRGRRLRVDGRTVALATPYLTPDLGETTLVRSRGVVDALGVLLRLSDLDLHARLSPEAVVARIVFDLCEQLRCEALVPTELPGLPGLAGNLDRAFDAWCRQARADRVADSGLGTLVYTVTHMVRSRLVRAVIDEEVDSITEATRGNLNPHVGHALRELRHTTGDQAAFAVHALEIAAVVADMVGDAGEQEATVQRDRHRILVPVEWVDDRADDRPDVPHETDRDLFAPLADATAASTDLAQVGDYRAFTRAYDVEVVGTDLARSEVLDRHRLTLDSMVRAQSVSPARLALQFRHLLGVVDHDGWEFEADAGVVDGRRLAQLARPADALAGPPNVFRRDRHEVACHAVVAFLVDGSGSMKAQRGEAVAVLVDTWCRALDLAGVSSEVLGFTTGGWNGGRALADWRRAGSPDQPGRLNEACHIVYKDADTPWRRSRRSLAAMLETRHHREGLDGEALAWAAGRLMARPERRRLLVVVSDGAPMDSATHLHNRDGFLDDHLVAVAGHLERSTVVELGALGLDRDVGAWYRNSVDLDLGSVADPAPLGLIHYGVLGTLFGPSRGA